MAMPALIPGTRLADRYRVDSFIGSGGYASVYRVHDLRTDRLYAMKEVDDPAPGIRQQFELEAQFLRECDHPNIPRAVDFFEEFGRAYLVMEYIEGDDLEQKLQQSLNRNGRPIDEAQALKWLIPICDALDFIHNYRSPPIIHRDIKPANIKLDLRGNPILIDFGLAKQSLPGPTKTAAQGVTPGYAPPEQYMAQGRTDARSDIYAVGATLYTLLTGHEPLEATSRLLAASGKSGEFLKPVQFYNSGVSDATAFLIDKAMSLGTSERQQSARELKDDIITALSQIETGRATIMGMPTGPLRPNMRGNRRQREDRRTLVASAPTTRIEPALQGYPGLASQMPLIIHEPPPWIDLKGPRIRRMGKIAIMLSAVEVYWGLMSVGALTAIISTNNFTSSPSVLAILGIFLWLAIFLGISVVMVLALTRPIARRGQISAVRRWFQGILLFLLWGGVNAVALMSFQLPTHGVTLAVYAILGLTSILVGLLNVANTLA